MNRKRYTCNGANDNYISSNQYDDRVEKIRRKKMKKDNEKYQMKQ